MSTTNFRSGVMAIYLLGVAHYEDVAWLEEQDIDLVELQPGDELGFYDWENDIFIPADFPPHIMEC